MAYVVILHHENGTAGFLAFWDHDILGRGFAQVGTTLMSYTAATPEGRRCYYYYYYYQL